MEEKTHSKLENIKEAIIFALIVILIVLIRMYIITPAIINGDSMEPNLSNGDIVLLYKSNQNIERFDIIVHVYDETRLVKRIIGMPGEHVEFLNNELYINGVIVPELYQQETDDFRLEDIGYDRIPENYFFVLGDNRNFSRDSRTIGLINLDNILGETTYRIYPFSGFGRID